MQVKNESTINEFSKINEKVINIKITFDLEKRFYLTNKTNLIRLFFKIKTSPSLDKTISSDKINYSCLLNFYIVYPKFLLPIHLLHTSALIKLQKCSIQRISWRFGQTIYILVFQKLDGIFRAMSAYVVQPKYILGVFWKIA